MFENYLVSGAGRVGGHLILNIIRSAGHNAIHTHDTNYTTGNDVTTALLVIDRRDRFSAIMSNAIVWHTGQSVDYDNINIDPFTIDINRFKLLYNLHCDHYKQYDFTRSYGIVEHFYYEDFVNNHDHVYNRLNLKKFTDLLPNWKPAPYNYKTLIQNESELRESYAELTNKAHDLVN
jgi:hypothetical protein